LAAHAPPIAYGMPLVAVDGIFRPRGEESDISAAERNAETGLMNETRTLTEKTGSIRQLIADLGFRPAILDYSVPDELSACIDQKAAGYQVDAGVNPFYLRGDFDGDGHADYAAFVTHEGKHGVLVCWAGRHSPTVLGAGKRFIQMDDLTFTGWKVHALGKKVEHGATDAPPPKLRGDAILVEWQEAASGLIYWAGEQFRWYQQGD